MRPSIFKGSLVQKQSHGQCIVNASQQSHTFDEQMVCVNFLLLLPALPLLYLSLTVYLPPLFPHIFFLSSSRVSLNEFLSLSLSAASTSACNPKFDK